MTSDNIQQIVIGQELFRNVWPKHRRISAIIWSSALFLLEHKYAYLTSHLHLASSNPKETQLQLNQITISILYPGVRPQKVTHEALFRDWTTPP